MKRLLNPMKFVAALALLAFAVGCATTQQTENLLSEAGFKTVSASTPKQQQRLKTLEPGKITPVRRDGKTTHFVFPDPAHNQLYVGGQAEHQKYQQLRLQHKLSNENLTAAEVKEHEDHMLKKMLAGWDWANPDALNLQDHLVRQSKGAAPAFITEQEAKDALREADRVDVLSLLGIREVLVKNWRMPAVG